MILLMTAYIYIYIVRARMNKLHYNQAINMRNKEHEKSIESVAPLKSSCKTFTDVYSCQSRQSQM